MFILLLTSMLTLAFNIRPVRASGTIYIRADGSIDPPDAPVSTSDNATYTFVGDISDSIVVERDNIVVDGAGYTVQGTGVPFVEGIWMNGRKNVTIRRTEIRAFDYGINLSNCSSIIISENTIRNGRDGLILSDASNNIISGNNMIDNDYYGIWLWNDCNNNTIHENNIANSSFGVEIDGGVAQQSGNNIISRNNIASSDNSGIYIVGCYSNVVYGNRIANNTYHGISIYSSSNNTIFDNDLRDNEMGIQLRGSSNNNIVHGNIVMHNSYGVYLEGLFSSEIGPSDNILYHNNLINNTKHVYSARAPSLSPASYPNLWNDDYPSGGNYWSDYNGTDVYTGPYQNLTGTDGIGDAPYVIDANNTDHYPLVRPYGALLGDVNGDGTVNMKDVMAAVQAFNSFRGYPRWNADADLDDSGRVDMRDIVMIVLNFNKHE